MFPRRVKGQLIAFAFILLTYALCSSLIYIKHASTSQSLPTATASDASVTISKNSAVENINIALMLRGLNQTLSKFMSRFHHEVNTKRATTKPTSKSTSKPTSKPTSRPTSRPTSSSTSRPTSNSTSKPSIDIVNDYCPFVDFKFVFPEINPKVKATPNIFMIVLVNSGAKGDEFRKRREAIRQTWGNQSNCEQRKALQDERLKHLRWLLVFVLGKAGTGTNDDELNIAEARQHNDMLIGNITDNYINNIIKFYMGQVWASRFDIKYTMKTDDDVYVRIPRVLEYLVNAKFPRPFYGGWTYAGTAVNRAIGGKWTVSWKYFGEKDWPRFNPGGFFILSADLLYRLFNYAYVRKPFHTDDAYVGVAMRDFGVKITTILSFRISPDMLQEASHYSDCSLLGKIALGHSIDNKGSKMLFDRYEKLLCGKDKKKC